LRGKIVFIILLLLLQVKSSKWFAKADEVCVSAFIFYGGIKMYFQRHGRKTAQSVIEYALLTAIVIIALLVGSNFISRLKSNAFENHFQSASYYIGGVRP
jgi:hypothetical protein